MSSAFRDPLRLISTLWVEEIRAVLTPASGRRLRLFGRILLIWLIETGGLLVLDPVLPGLHVSHPAAALGLVIAIQVLNAVIRPVLVYLALPLLVLSLGTVVLFINGLVVMAADGVVPGIAIDGYGWAFVVALGLALVNASVGWLLDLGEEESFYRGLTQRLARRGQALRVGDRPGTIIVQIDGLGHDVLVGAIRTGQAPTLARWIREGTHRLVEWECALPSQTSASQAGILLGDNRDIPAFRWYEKPARRLLVSNRPADAAEIERRLSDGHGLLSRNGSSIGNLLSGDAHRSVLTMSTIADLSPGLGRRSRDFFLYFVNPYSTTRGIFRMLLEIFIERRQARRQAGRGVVPRMDRGGAFPFLRAVSCVLLRDIAVTLLVEDMVRGIGVAYADFVSYDEIAHHAGPERPEALGAVEELDRQLAALERASASAPRPYRFIVLSDHGQSFGPTFRQRYGQTLEATIAGLMRGDAPAGTRGPSVEAATGSVEGWGHLNAFLAEVLSGHGPVARGLRRLVGRAERVEVGPVAVRPVAAGPTTPELVVCASGNLALIYFTIRPDRLSLEAIEVAFPGLIASLASHPGVGLILVRSEADGPVVLGPAGRRRLRDDAIEGIDPLAQFGPRAADHLRRLDGFANVGDLVVNSLLDPVSGEVAAFEELIGSHGGLGGPQTRPFLLFPAEYPAPDGPIVGAPALHRILAGWLSRPASTGEPGSPPPPMTAQDVAQQIAQRSAP